MMMKHIAQFSKIVKPSLPTSYKCCAVQRLLHTVSSKDLKKQNGFLKISDEVMEALHTGRPLVALESTIITHGMPNPHNLSTALSVEKKIRESGTIPATVAVLQGKLCVGLNETQIIWLAEKNSDLIKISRRDLPFILSQGYSGGTTVSATMIAAHMAGISIFATGGIGGVHRGAEESFDVSADLTELGRTPVAVVSSGVKSILDIPKTLEYLETQGVCVMTFGSERHFPAFFTRDSGQLSPYNVNSPIKAAQVIDSHIKLGLESGLLIAVPIPEEFTSAGDVIQAAITEALDLAKKQNICGKEVTPFLLSTVNHLTKGQSLEANIALIENNASVAGRIAFCLHQLRQNNQSDPVTASRPLFTTIAKLSSLNQASKPRLMKKDDDSCRLTGRPVVIGSTVVDFSVQVTDPKFQLNGGTYTGQVSQSFGGVGRNLADCLCRLNHSPVFVSAVGTDSHAASLSALCQHMDLSAVQKIENMTTATCCVLLYQGKFLFGVGDMNVNSKLMIDQIKNLDSLIASAPLVVLDGNFTTSFITSIVDKCARLSVPVWFEPTDLYKCKAPFQSDAWKKLTFVSPNLVELVSMYQAMRQRLGQDDIQVSVTEDSDLQEILDVSVSMCQDLVKHIPVVLLTLGRHGVLLCHRLGQSECFLPITSQISSSDEFKAVYYPSFSLDMDPSEIVSVSGAGDCLAATICAGMLSGQTIDECIRHGLLAAYLSLQSLTAVPETVSLVAIKALEQRWPEWNPIYLTVDNS
ncbi:pseudouridine-metabolizing bifunctional protein C1861.05 [Biomphalaria glabrata]|nr:pseudouridine-metabolizing bifunctional protein C1861.05-like [Biomphalaria glabrata]